MLKYVEICWNINSSLPFLGTWRSIPSEILMWEGVQGFWDSIPGFMYGSINSNINMWIIWCSSPDGQIGSDLRWFHSLTLKITSMFDGNSSSNRSMLICWGVTWYIYIYIFIYLSIFIYLCIYIYVYKIFAMTWYVFSSGLDWFSMIQWYVIKN